MARPVWAGSGQRQARAGIRLIAGAAAMLLGTLLAAAATAAEPQTDKAMALLGVTSIPDSTASAISISRGTSGDALGLTFGQFGLGFTVDNDFPLYMEGFLGYGRYDPRFVVSGGAAQQSGRVFMNQGTMTLGLGWDIKLTNELVLRPIINGTTGFVASDLSLFGGFIDYRRDTSLRITDSGSTSAYGTGGSLMLDYARYRPGYEIDAELRYTNLNITGMDRSASGHQPKANAQTAALWSRLRLPTEMEVMGRPVRYLVEFAHSQFMGDQPAALGFHYLTKVGGGLEIDVGRAESTLFGLLYLQRIRLVGRYVFGDRVQGFSVGLGFGF